MKARGKKTPPIPFRDKASQCSQRRVSRPAAASSSHEAPEFEEPDAEPEEPVEEEAPVVEEEEFPEVPMPDPPQPTKVGGIPPVPPGPPLAKGTGEATHVQATPTATIASSPIPADNLFADMTNTVSPILSTGRPKGPPPKSGQSRSSSETPAGLLRSADPTPTTSHRYKPPPGELYKPPPSDIQQPTPNTYMSTEPTPVPDSVKAGPVAPGMLLPPPRREQVNQQLS